MINLSLMRTSLDSAIKVDNEKYVSDSSVNFQRARAGIMTSAKYHSNKNLNKTESEAE